MMKHHLTFCVDVKCCSDQSRRLQWMRGIKKNIAFALWSRNQSCTRTEVAVLEPFQTPLGVNCKGLK